MSILFYLSIDLCISLYSRERPSRPLRKATSTGPLSRPVPAAFRSMDNHLSLSTNDLSSSSPSSFPPPSFPPSLSNSLPPRPATLGRTPPNARTVFPIYLSRQLNNHKNTNDDNKDRNRLSI